MKIVFMGTPDFAVPSLRALAESPHEVTAVVTQPDRPRGRGKKLIPTPVKQFANLLGIPVIQPERLSHIKAKLEEIAPEAIVVVAFGQILPRDILDIPPVGCINVHASLLPKFRGAAPIHRAIINGEKSTGITTMFMDRGLDAGDILLKEEVIICECDTVGDLHDRLAETGARLLLETLDRIEKGTITRVPQNDEEATYAPPLTRDDEIINWHKSAREIKNLVRGLNPWPGARTTLNRKVLKVWRVTAVGDGGEREGPCGCVTGIDPEKGIIVQTGDGKVLITELQLQGKKRMPAPQFLRGHGVEPGTVLGNGNERKVCNERSCSN